MYRRIPQVILACAVMSLLWMDLPSPVHAAAGDKEFKAGQKAEALQNYDEAYRQYQMAVRANPSNPQFTAAFERAKFQAGAFHVERGHALRAQDQLEQAATEYQMALAMDPSNAAARQSLESVRAAIAARNTQAQAQEQPGMPSLAQAQGPPQLQPLSRAPIDLRMTNDPKVIFETIGKLAGINVLFDPDYKPSSADRVTVELSGVTLEEALEQVSTITKTFWKPLTRNTILVVQDNAVKRREQEQQVIKTFYLSNTITPQELTEVVTAIRTLLETRRIQQVNSMNAVILRDTPDKIALAQKIIEDVDKAKPEVVVDVAIIEIRRDKARQLGLTPVSAGTNGISIPGTFTPGGQTGDNAPKSVPLDRLDNLSTGDWSITLPGAQLNAVLSDAHTKILQRPELRATDGMRATLRIGDRVPIATGAFQPGVAGQVVSAIVQTQFQYQDVGVNLDVTPKVHTNREITLKVRAEISAVTQQVDIGGIKQPVFGQRIVEHDIRLREGETTVLGGILASSTQQTTSGVPGLSQIPLLKYLFSNVSDTIADDEVLILMRPHTVRLPDIRDVNLKAIDIGTEGDVHLRMPSSEPSQQPVPGAYSPFETPAPSAPAAAQPAGAPAPVPGAALRPEAPAARSAEALSAPPAQFRFERTAVTPHPGETFQMALRLENGQDIYSVPLDLLYDSRALRLVRVNQGDFLGTDGMPIAVAEHSADVEGRTAITLTRPPGSGGVSGTGTLAVFTFQALQPGTVNISAVPSGVRSETNAFIAVRPTETSVTVR